MNSQDCTNRASDQSIKSQFEYSHGSTNRLKQKAVTTVTPQASRPMLLQLILCSALRGDSTPTGWLIGPLAPLSSVMMKGEECCGNSIPAGFRGNPGSTICKRVMRDIMTDCKHESVK
ncbi:hypothetical protein J4Q44_G00133350 [Coregonus suidteri]|uniref:Uncharacterized protein n=1 Tax=Coregonus suidteri TaxID=861788 RepID=A0AAN8MAZ6_9TELE